MGNCVSASFEVNASKIRVVQAVEGCVVDIEVPISQAGINVGELMLEFPPGRFIAELDKANLLSTTGKRAAPLRADADAKPGAVYVLFPMPRLHTRITPQELLTFAKLLQLHDQRSAKAAFLKPQVYGLFTAGARVAPLSQDDFKDQSLNGGEQLASALFKMQQDEQEAIYSSSSIGQMQVIKSKPWAPKLDTIQETS